jgi:uncharacterized membrane protein YoaK (UPF0700 family)
VGGVLSFLLGAATTTLIVSYAQRREWHSAYALPLLIEALLLTIFGMLGSALASINGLFVPATVMLLCSMMGLQNALITNVSRSEIRTTHITGIITDIGIELGKLFYWNATSESVMSKVTADRERLLTLTTLAAMFFVGGLLGALGFKYASYASTLPLAVLLIALAMTQIREDMSQSMKRGV